MGTRRGLDLTSGVQMSQCIVRILELRLPRGESSMTMSSLLLPVTTATLLKMRAIKILFNSLTERW